MALSTLRLRESQQNQPGIRQYADKSARPSPQNIQEVLTLSQGLRKLRVSEKPELIPRRPVLPGIKSGGIQFTDCDASEVDPELDKICAGVSESGILGFLKKSQIMLNVLHHWWWEDTNSLEFLHWWLARFSHEQRSDWFKLECSILLEEISASITTPYSREKVMEFLVTVLHEHPHTFCDVTQTTRLPDMLETLVGSDKQAYCELLSHAKCRTNQLETVLGLRTYCVISVCYAAVSFYRKLVTEKVHAEHRPPSRSSAGGRVGTVVRPGSSVGTVVRPGSSLGTVVRPGSSVGTVVRPGSSLGTVVRPGSSLGTVVRPGSSLGRVSSVMSTDSASRPTTAQNTDRVEQHNIGRAFDCVIRGYVGVLQYLFERGYVDSLITDNQGRSLVFVATLHKQHSVLNYLLSEAVQPPCDPDLVADNGNTPLHVASSAGNSLALNILLKAGSTPDLFNPESNGATPLHLAVCQDSVDCVILLLGAGADPMTRMGCPADTSAIDLARQLQHSDVLKLLIGAVPARPESGLYLEGDGEEDMC